MAQTNGTFVQKYIILIILHLSRYIFDPALPACALGLDLHGSASFGLSCLLDSTCIQQMYQQETREQEENAVRIFTLMATVLAVATLFNLWPQLLLGNPSRRAKGSLASTNTAPSLCPFEPRGGEGFSLSRVPDHLTM